MKMAKKIVAAAVAALTVGTFNIGASAAIDGTSTAEYTGYVGFGTYHLADKGGREETNFVQKHDDFTYCAVYVEKGTVSSTSPVYLAVYNDDNQLAAPSTSATKLNPLDENYNSIKMYYYDGMGNVGTRYSLHLNAGYTGVTVSGQWAP